MLVLIVQCLSDGGVADTACYYTGRSIGGMGGGAASPSRVLLLLLLNTTRRRSGPPSTRATITMDGGVADTARANTKARVNTGR